MRPDEVQEEMERLRDAIDRVDEVIVKLLNQRARYAIEIGHVKKEAQLAIYSPEREKKVLSNIERWSKGPLESRTMRRLFERIIDESRRVERLAAEKEEKRRGSE
ncbi:MAG: chorismate mutase [Thermoanaerobaculia bacterium]|nr:chorismate mutase [Thermoanaerobaculia bacterium]